MRSLFVFFCLLGITSLFAQQNILHNHHSGQHDIDIPSVLSYEIIDFDNDLIALTSRSQNLSSHFINLGKHGQVEVQLESYQLISPDYILRNQDGIVRSRQTTQTLRGVSADGGEVRLTIAENFTYGFIEWNDETYWIEPAWYYQKNADQTNDIVVYKQSDVIPDHEMTCAADLTRQKTEDLYHHGAGERSSSRLGQCYEVDLAIASDYSMYTKYNSSTANVENHNIAVINNVNGNYTGEFDDDIEFNIVTQWISTCSSCDPWTSETNALTVLQSFTAWGSGGNFMVDHDIGEFWTNRDFDGSTVGIAWVGEVCTNFRYHCLQDHSSNAGILRVTAAHEIGHNFNAQHAPVNNFIMSEFVSNTNQWHPNSINTISNYIASIASQGGCFSPCPAGDAPQAAMEPLATNICPGTTIKFFDRSLNNPSNWTWTFPGGSPGSSTDQHPTVTYDVQGTFPVMLEVSNAAGSNSQTYSNLINVGDGGSSFPLYQDFDSGFDNWSIENPDNSITWELSSPGAAPGGTTAAVIDNFTYPNLGRRDALISPVFSLAGYQTATLHIEYAHAAFTSGLRDSLIVYVSGDDGQSYQRLFANAENGSGNFATRLPFGGPFNPQSLTDWCGTGGFGASCLNLDLTNYLGSRDVIVRIENYTNSGNNTYIDRVYVTSNCFNLPPPEAEFTGQPNTGCSPLVVQFQDLSQNSPFSWLWSFENGSPATSTIQNPEVVFTTPGEQAVTLTVMNESGTDVEIKNAFINVIDIPQAAFTFNAMGATVDFQNLTPDATGFNWDFGDGNGSIEENPSHTYASDGSYEVTLQVFNDCGLDEITITVVIGTVPQADYEASPFEGCVPMEVQFVSTSSANATSFQWIFEGGAPATSNDDNPLVTYNSPGVFDVTLIAINSTGADTLINENAIEVGETPVAAFSFNSNDFSVTFLNMSSGAEGYLWTFGDGESSMDENPMHTYSSGGLYDVVLIASNDCGTDTISQTVALGGFPSAQFTSDITTGCAPLSVTFNADNAVAGDMIAWTFEGGTPATSNMKNPTIEFSTPGEYDVMCVVTNAIGSDTALLLNYVVVQGPPDVGFEDDYDGFLTIDFTYTGSPYDDIHWDFGDGNFASVENPSHSYDEIALWTYSCIASNTCGADTVSGEFLRSDPLVDVSGIDGTECAGLFVQFNVGGIDNSPTFEWVFEGGLPSTSDETNPLVQYTQSGIYDVTLTATQNGASITYTWEESVTIENEPIADFILDMNAIVNASINATEFLWYVDGDFTSDEMDLALTDEGNYEVMLIALNSCGADTFEQSIFISAVQSLPVWEQGMNIAPNPSNGAFELSFDRPIAEYEMIMTNSSGQEVFRQDKIHANQQLHQFDLPAGLYVVRAIVVDGMFISKALIVR